MPMSTCKPTNHTRLSAFTLIELLVVIAMIALIISILVPSLARAREQARRANCASHVRQLLLGCQLYANGNDDFLPAGHSDDPITQNEVTMLLSADIRNKLVGLIGDKTLLQCPSLGMPFTDPNGWYIPGNGYMIGYNYLAGHRETPWAPVADAGIDPNDYGEWISPQKASAKGNPALITDLNTWSTYVYNLYTFVPHGPRGAITEAGDCRNSLAGGARSDVLGAIGGNQGALDGSVGWKHVQDMKIRRATYPFTSCFSMWAD